jgi:hypothetical protein
VSLRGQGEDAKALEVFERAQLLNPSPRATAQVALANQALGRWVAAELGLMQALTASGDGWIAVNRAALEQALATVRTHLAWIGVESNVPGAEVWQGGRPIASLPLGEALRVVAGPIDIEVRAASYKSATRHLEVAPGQHVQLYVALNQAPPARAAETPPSKGSSPSTSLVATRVAAWGALGAAATLITGALMAQVDAETNASTYNDNKLCLVAGATRYQTCGPYRSRAVTAQALAVAGYASAGALALVSGYFFFVGRSAPHDAHSSAPQVSGECAAAPWSLTCTLAF